MSKKIVQINYKITNSFAEHMQMISPAAPLIAAVPGLVWKVWLQNEAEHEVGGIMLFENLETAQAYLSGPIAKGFGHPTIHSVNIKIFGLIEEESLVTRAPITWGHLV